MVITAKGFENSHTIFGVLLSMHVSVLTVSNLGCRFSDLDIGARVFEENMPIETFKKLFQSTLNKQQYGT